jgi:hypothetical protein
LLAASVVDGSDMEPFRTATAMAARSVRAGSAPPTATEKIPDTDLTVEQLDERRKWQKREEKVQGVIRTTVADGIVIDIVDMNSAKQMRDYILATHQLDSPEEQAQVRDALATIRLMDDPSAEEMETHLERFNSLPLRARTASLKIDEAERIERFLATSWQRCQRLLPCCDFNSDWRIRSGRHGLKSQSNTTLKLPIDSVHQEQETAGFCSVVKDTEERPNIGLPQEECGT